MYRIYGSEMCPDCLACKKNFDAYGVEYEFIDILSSLRPLKEFLILRDKEPVFDRLKAIHDIGIPALIAEDGTVFTNWEQLILDMGQEILTVEGYACSLDGKGC